MSIIGFFPGLVYCWSQKVPRLTEEQMLQLNQEFLVGFEQD